MRPLAPGLLASLCGVCVASSAAQGYTIKNAFAAGCHERITSLALRTVRAELKTAAPLTATANEEALIIDLQFKPEDDMADLGAVTLVIGVRDNDLKGRGSGDLTELAEIHGDPADQAEHCLRDASQKEPAGTEASIKACRAFIRGRIAEALEGLDASGNVDSEKRTSLAVHLSIRGGVEALLPTYYVRMGQAMHAVQDSFTHSYRSVDGMQITVALNWLAFVNKTLVESADGPAHAAVLDVCDDPDDLRRHKRELATDASAALLRATLDPSQTKDQKMAAVDAALDRYLGFKPGCTFENGWCDAPEAKIPKPAGCGCASTTQAAALGTLFAFLALSRRARRLGTFAGLLAVCFALPFTIGSAQAQADGGIDEHAPPPPTVTAVAEALPVDPSQMAFGGYAAVGASFDKAALAVTLGARLRLTRRWSIGLDGEWNPWFALNGTPVRRGVINAFLTGILRFPLAYENFNLRSTLSAGTSVLLSNFYGAPAGSVGLYFGLSPLGLEWKAHRLFYLIINPLNIALPIPQISGVPFFYPQYRVTVGLEFYAG